LNIRNGGDFPRWRLELELRLCFVVARRTEGVGWAGAVHALMLLGFTGPRHRPHVREEWKARLGWLG
jgi:hypothetical protein